MRQLAKKILPPFVVSAIKRVKVNDYGWSGDYGSWGEALKDSDGYDSERIIEKVKNATLKVVNGEKPYERDSVLFDEIQYSWPLLNALMWISARNGGTLNIIDFGGSLGSTYYQNRVFFEHLKVRWNVVEQGSFVQFGKTSIHLEQLSFYDYIDSCQKITRCDSILLSSVLPYLESPYAFLKEVIKRGFKWILIDRTPFNKDGYDRLTVQKVSPEIYEASYPCWIFDHQKFNALFLSEYTLISEFDALAGSVPLWKPAFSYRDKGFIFERRK